MWCSWSLNFVLCWKNDKGNVFKFAAEAIKVAHDWRVEMPVPWKWRMNETREPSSVIETERLWRVP